MSVQRRLTLVWTGLAFLTIKASAATPPPSRDEVARLVEPILANPPADGLLVFEVIPGSQAERHGFQIGDVITDYNGQPAPTIAEFGRLFKEALQNGDKEILVIGRRGDEVIETILDPAPVGVRFVSIRKDEKRTLWRKPTTFQPAWDVLSEAAESGHSWEILMRNGKVVGWTHSWIARQGKGFVLRLQSRLQAGPLDEKHDVVISFAQDRYLSPRSLRIAGGDHVLLDLIAADGKWRGERSGIPVAEMLPADTVSAYTAGLVARMMPLEVGSCLRCSAAPAGSLSSTPFADVYCAGTEEFEIAGKKVNAFRYEYTMFGDIMAEYWITGDRRIVLTAYPNGVAAVPSSASEVAKSYPEWGREFGPIEQLPERLASQAKGKQ